MTSSAADEADVYMSTLIRRKIRDLKKFDEAAGIQNWTQGYNWNNNNESHNRLFEEFFSTDFHKKLTFLDPVKKKNLGDFLLSLDDNNGGVAYIDKFCWESQRPYLKCLCELLISGVNWDSTKEM